MTPDPLPSEDPDRGLDVDARFAEIIAGWEPTIAEDEPGVAAEAPAPEPAPEPAPPDEQSAERLRGLFQPTWNDPLDTEATWEDEGHFVPPPPPPLPQVEPRRRLAWGALVGTPLIAMLMLGAGFAVRGFVAFLLVAAFIGGFGYLVATMRSGPDDWSGDDGARL